MNKEPSAPKKRAPYTEPCIQASEGSLGTPKELYMPHEKRLIFKALHFQQTQKTALYKEPFKEPSTPKKSFLYTEPYTQKSSKAPRQELNSNKQYIYKTRAPNPP